jgi:hypothetical protein
MPQLRHQIHLAKKSLLDVFTILCTNLQLACKALKKKQSVACLEAPYIYEHPS